MVKKTVQKHVQSGIWSLSAFETLESQREDGNELCESLCKGTTKIQWEQLATFLRRDYPNHHAQMLGGVDDDGFVKAGKKRGNFFYYWKFGLDLRDRETYERLYETTPGNSHTAASRPLN